MSDTGRMRLRVEEAEALLRKHEERLQLAIDAGQLGIWDWDIVHDRVTWSDRVYELHGLERGSFGASRRPGAGAGRHHGGAGRRPALLD
jgi:PAS domain-containing protein